jgi:hypothetical protein
LQLLDAQALAWVPAPPDRPLVAGESPVGTAALEALANDLRGRHDLLCPTPYLCNDPDVSWRACLPGTYNLLAIGVGGQAPAAVLVAFNKKGQAAARAPFRTSDAALLSPFASLLSMHGRAAARLDEMRASLLGLARCLAAAIDGEAEGHSERVACLAAELGRELGLSGEQLGDVYLAGLLHDVDRLDARASAQAGREDEEPAAGQPPSRHLRPLQRVLLAVLSHRERFDGLGRPEGRQGEGVPLLARLLAVAEGFDALSRPDLPLEQALEGLRRGSGTRWDPQVVAAAVRCADRLAAIGRRRLSESLRQAVAGASSPGESVVL